jgi:hypothetical protein
VKPAPQSSLSHLELVLLSSGAWDKEGKRPVWDPDGQSRLFAAVTIYLTEIA